MILINALILISIIILLFFVEKSQVRVLYFKVLSIINTRKIIQSIDCMILRVIDLLRSKLRLIHNRLGYVFKRLGGQRSKTLSCDYDFWQNDLKVGDLINESS